MKYLAINQHISLAYQQIPGKEPGVIFCGGFMSDMSGTKALAMENFCRRIGHAFIRFDYRGHGASKGSFTESTIGAWRDDVLAIVNELTQGPQVLIGSSMGGWIAALVALACPQRIKGLLGIAVAPDFTEELLWEKFPAEHKAILLREKQIQLPCAYQEKPYIFTLDLIEEGRQHLLLQQQIPLDIPVRLFHGLEDQDVPWQYSLRLAEKITSKDVRICLIKDGDHRLMREQDLLLLTASLSELLVHVC